MDGGPTLNQRWINVVCLLESDGTLYPLSYLIWIFTHLKLIWDQPICWSWCLSTHFIHNYHCDLKRHDQDKIIIFASAPWYVHNMWTCPWTKISLFFLIVFIYVPRKAKTQYLLTLQVCRYCLLALQSRGFVAGLLAGGYLITDSGECCETIRNKKRGRSN